MYRTILLFLVLFGSFCDHIDTKFNSIAQNSLSQNIAFYLLYPTHRRGIDAQKQVAKMLNTNIADLTSNYLFNIASILSPQKMEGFSLNRAELKWIDSITQSLETKRLPGHKLWDIKAICALQDHEIDLSRALLLLEGVDKNTILAYEAALDVMALHIKQSLPKNASAVDIADAINRLLFYEMGIRYPPVKIGTANSGVYSSIIPMLNRRQGICLGTSLLYMCIRATVGATCLYCESTRACYCEL